jgi:hypothetical protein
MSAAAQLRTASPKRECKTREAPRETRISGIEPADESAFALGVELHTFLSRTLSKDSQTFMEFHRQLDSE